MFIFFNPALQLGKCIVKAILWLFQDAIDQETNNISQYRLGLQINSLDRDCSRKTEETRDQNQNLLTE
jgi:hypothetical protein